MANRRFNRGGGLRRGPRRQTEWLALAAPTASTALAASSKIQFATQSAAEITKLPFTIVRTIGFVNIEQQSLVDSTQSGAFGITIVSDRAQAVGITALPDPVTEFDADYWFLYIPWSTTLVEDATGLSSTPFHTVFDSKAQRKVEEGDRIAGIMANASAAQAIEFQISFRMLIKLH